MYQNKPVIMIIPAGRERYMRLLIPHLLARRDLLDACHLWMNTSNPLDAAYLRQLERDDPGFFRCVPCPGPVEGNRSISRSYTAEYRVPGGLYVKIDDDIVWLAEDSLRRLLEFRVANPEYFLVSADVWNNQLLDHLRQRAGLLAQEPFIEWNCLGSAWSSGAAAERIHRALMTAICQGRAEGTGTVGLGQGFDRWVFRPEERFSINLVCWQGEDLAALSPHGLEGPFPGADDEAFLSCEAPRLLGKKNAVCGAAPAAHFAFGPQREHMDRTNLLELWEGLCPSAPAPLRGALTASVLSGASPEAETPRCELIFTHHRNDAVTRRNFESFRQFAPPWCRVIPVHVRGSFESCLEGSVEVSLEGLPRNRGDRISGIWTEVDLVISAWSEMPESTAPLLVQVEYDVRAHAPLAPLLDLCARMDCVGNHRHSPVCGYWADMHREVKGEEWLHGKSQMVPVAFRSASRPALKLMTEEIRNNPLWHDVYCELRAPSVADHLGLESHYLNAPLEMFWWQGPAQWWPGSWIPLTHPSKE